MGSERLSHMFATMKDPTFKENSSSTKHEDNNSSSHNSLSHTSGTQPVSLSNGPRSSSPPMIKHKPKINSKYKKLIKLYSRQLSHISTTINAIESLSKTESQHQILVSSKKRLDELNETLEDFRNTPTKQDHIHFDPLKNDIDQLMNDLKSYKTDTNDPHSTNTIDYLVGFPLDVSDNENEEDKTLIYT